MSLELIITIIFLSIIPFIIIPIIVYHYKKYNNFSNKSYRFLIKQEDEISKIDRFKDNNYYLMRYVYYMWLKLLFENIKNNKDKQIYLRGLIKNYNKVLQKLKSFIEKDIIVHYECFEDSDEKIRNFDPFNYKNYEKKILLEWSYYNMLFFIKNFFYIVKNEVKIPLGD